jgi:hypothetical protein
VHNMWSVIPRKRQCIPPHQHYFIITVHGVITEKREAIKCGENFVRY